MQNTLIVAALALYALYCLWARKFNRSEESRLTNMFNAVQPTIAALGTVPMSLRGDRFCIELTCIYNSLGSAERDIRNGRWAWADLGIATATSRAQSLMLEYAHALPQGANA